ncbi:MAG: hypothetical protein JWP13_293 [Candidatus Saccharibacteria bacterium]|nr:hypothetical protein [Candidatus Saccharibacteria bacterium]
MHATIVIMKVVILYRPESEHARSIETFVRDFSMRNPNIRLETLNVDERDGIAKCEVYGIMRYPALLAVAEDGRLIKLWNDDMLPLMDEVASYAYSG